MIYVRCPQGYKIDGEFNAVLSPNEIVLYYSNPKKDKLGVGIAIDLRIVQLDIYIDQIERQIGSLKEEIKKAEMQKVGL